MVGLNRRDAFRVGGGAALAALAWQSGICRAAADDAAPDILSHVAPELRPFAAQMLQHPEMMPEFNARTITAARAGGPPVAPPLADVPVRTQSIPVGQGNPDISITIINAAAGEKRPGILHTHGGGFIIGSVRYEVRRLQEIARELDCVIVTVDYRLAPETRYAGSIADNYAGLSWMHAHALELGIDRARIALMGESAGGGHAALLAIAARDRGEVPLVAQVLIYPMLEDRTGSTQTLPAFMGAFIWTPASNRYGWESFLGQTPGGPHVPATAVPARVANLAGLAPAFIAVGGIDLFVSEDIEYARRLTAAGVPTDLLVVPGAFHAFDAIAPQTAVARRFTLAKMNALRRAFGQPEVF